MVELRDGGAWGSALSPDGFAAIRSVGFAPVGQVFGAAVYQLSATVGASCPGTRKRDAYTSPEALGTTVAAASGHDVPGPATRIALALYEGRRTAIDRMAAECVDLRAHGVVGASVQVREIPADAFSVGAVEFKVIGTAVRAGSWPPLATPFTSDLSGQDFAKLVMAGWVPAGIAFGISIAALHDDGLATGARLQGAGNTEVPAYTVLITKARQGARSRLEEAVSALGADGVVVSGVTLAVRADACHRGGTDHFAEAVITGTAVAQFADGRDTARPSLAVLSLDAVTTFSDCTQRPTRGTTLP
jgi:uncharacterized protein YbjQ (UPF0145 family)